ncbi:MAG: hypothetical protein JSS81_05850 [Acidobacteria bacterium]|nr:hypothetical protein [Acidobacteriota bacterium]
MAALIDETYMRTTFKIHKDVVSGRLLPYIAVASRKLQSWVGAANYADSGLAEILKLAEGSLAMSFLTLNLNTNVRPQGLIKVEKVEGEVTIQYLSPAETAQTSAQWFEQAEALVRDLLQLSDLPAPPQTVEETLDCDSGSTFPEWQI